MNNVNNIVDRVIRYLDKVDATDNIAIFESHYRDVEKNFYFVSNRKEMRYVKGVMIQEYYDNKEEKDKYLIVLYNDYYSEDGDKKVDFDLNSVQFNKIKEAMIELERRKKDANRVKNIKELDTWL